MAHESRSTIRTQESVDLPTRIETRRHWWSMPCRMVTVKAWRQAFLLAAFLVLTGCGRSPNASMPGIAITRIPSADGNTPDTVAAIEGTVVGVRPDQQIVVYTRGEELWWVQPVPDRPFTQIQNG